MPSSDAVPLAFDLFISYAHADNRGEDHRKVSALVEAIRADYQRVAGGPLRVFFDVGEIRTMDDWESRILLGLRQSKMMVAVLSPAYFRSDYCRKEWETYVETELAHALPGDGIAPIYVVKHPDFESESVEDRLKHWVRDLKRRQYIDWLDFWPEGAAALERAEKLKNCSSSETPPSPRTPTTPTTSRSATSIWASWPWPRATRPGPGGTSSTTWRSRVGSRKRRPRTPTTPSICGCLAGRSPTFGRNRRRGGCGLVAACLGNPRWHEASGDAHFARG
jgi:TIR domain